MGKNILTKELLLKSVEEWNTARKAYPNYKPNFYGADFCKSDLRGVDFRGADLRGTDFSEADLRWADLGDSDLRGAYLCRVNLSEANLNKVDLSYLLFKRGADGVLGSSRMDGITGTNLTGANLHAAFMPEANLNTAYLQGADLSDALLSGADLSGVNFVDANLNRARLHRADLQGTILIRTKLIEADLSSAEFKGAILSEANFSMATISDTIFGDVDLSCTFGLDTIRHEGPSTIGIDTIYASKGNIPEVFMRGCGVPDNFIEYVRSLTATPFDYYSCFISHSTADKVFADRLYADLQAKGVRCWYAPHDMEGGEHVDTQIDRAIKIHEKLLLILSESSIKSNWVKREITKTFKREEAEGKRVLFPISLVDFSKIEDWEFVDSKGRDLSEEIRKFYIPSFKGWENDNSLYTTEFDKLLKAFKDKSKQ
jgi:uncharacterized protein YjbI with pentapeptide repeats